ncbi:MAG: alpha/beta hydrolase [Coleofasciculus sp. G3-WIS-01]|uniref:alpha/beta hydrolase n=1 Tax=Coleofasciculus sp. G3-WIS-01 TaxID=3069528 RepID=UPI0032F2647F
MSDTPDYILFAQHGWADTEVAIAAMAQTLATPQTLVITPNLGWLKTWWRIKPLIKQVDEIATETIAKYPDTPIRIIGYSLGGLVWVELLNRHPEWWTQVESLVLVASPIGGVDLARNFTFLGMGVGIAGAMLDNRRQMAESIAKVIPTLVIAGDVGGGTDGAVTLEETKVPGANFFYLPTLSHPTLKNHPAVAEVIRDFWQNPVIING